MGVVRKISIIVGMLRNVPRHPMFLLKIRKMCWYATFKIRKK